MLAIVVWFRNNQVTILWQSLLICHCQTVFALKLSSATAKINIAIEKLVFFIIAKNQHGQHSKYNHYYCSKHSYRGQRFLRSHTLGISEKILARESDVVWVWDGVVAVFTTNLKLIFMRYTHIDQMVSSAIQLLLKMNWTAGLYCHCRGCTTNIMAEGRVRSQCSRKNRPRHTLEEASSVVPNQPAPAIIAWSFGSFPTIMVIHAHDPVRRKYF